MPCPDNLQAIILLFVFLWPQVRDAAEESDTGSQPVEPDVIVVQPPSPERGPEGEDTGTDNAQLIYASVSEEYKQKKRSVTHQCILVLCFISQLGPSSMKNTCS